jgi:hypothetical protein
MWEIEKLPLRNDAVWAKSLKPFISVDTIRGHYMLGRGALRRRRAAGAGQLAKVLPRHMLGDDLRDDSVFTGLAILQHVVQIPLALRP